MKSTVMYLSEVVTNNVDRYVPRLNCERPKIELFLYNWHGQCSMFFGHVKYSAEAGESMRAVE